MADKKCVICGAETSGRSPTCGVDCGYQLRQQRLKENRGEKIEAPTGEEHRINGNSWTISAPCSRVCSLDDAIKQFEIDTKVWRVSNFVANKWEVGAKDADGNIQVEPLYQIKLWLERRVKEISVEQEIERLKALSLKEIKRIPPKVNRPRRGPTGNLGELAISDPHFGKYAWSRETGGDDYDLDVAEKRFRDAARSALQRFEQERVDQILMPIGNDLLHADNDAGTTTSGTPVDVDTRTPKVYEKAFNAMVEAVEEARHVAPVKLLLVRGNHDEFGSWTLAHALHAWFRNYKDVEVDYEPRLRKSFEWGKVLLIFTHGKHENRKELPLLAMSEFREQAGRARFVEVHTGDLHQVRLEEKYGVRVRILPSFAAADAWHAKKGYVGNIPQAEAYVFNKDAGMIGMWPWTAV